MRYLPFRIQWGHALRGLALARMVKPIPSVFDSRLKIITGRPPGHSAGLADAGDRALGLVQPRRLQLKLRDNFSAPTHADDSFDHVANRMRSPRAGMENMAKCLLILAGTSEKSNYVLDEDKITLLPPGSHLRCHASVTATHHICDQAARFLPGTVSGKNTDSHNGPPLPSFRLTQQSGCRLADTIIPARFEAIV